MKERTRIILLIASCFILISAIVLSNLIIEIVGMLLLGFSISEYLKWMGFLFFAGSVFIVGTLADMPIFNYSSRYSAIMNGLVVVCMIIGYAQGRSTAFRLTKEQELEMAESGELQERTRAIIVCKRCGDVENGSGLQGEELKDIVEQGGGQI